jgi:hypothetical protein
MALRTDGTNDGRRRHPMRGVTSLLLLGLFAAAACLVLGIWLGQELPTGSAPYRVSLAIDLVSVLTILALGVLAGWRRWRARRWRPCRMRPS